MNHLGLELDKNDSLRSLEFVCRLMKSPSEFDREALLLIQCLQAIPSPSLKELRVHFLLPLGHETQVDLFSFNWTPVISAFERSAFKEAHDISILFAFHGDPGGGSAGCSEQDVYSLGSSLKRWLSSIHTTAMFTCSFDNDKTYWTISGSW